MSLLSLLFLNIPEFNAKAGRLKVTFLLVTERTRNDPILRQELTLDSARGQPRAQAALRCHLLLRIVTFAQNVTQNRHFCSEGGRGLKRNMAKGGVRALVGESRITLDSSAQSTTSSLGCDGNSAQSTTSSLGCGNSALGTPPAPGAVTLP